MTPLFRQVCVGFVPSWRGLPLPTPLPWREQLRLRLSLALADLAALRYHGRTFRLLTVAEREAMLTRLLNHPRPRVRRHALRWKQLALLTA